MAEYSVRHPYTVLAGVVLALLLGGMSLLGLRTDLLPPVETAALLVVTVCPGGSPEKIEAQVTVPVEKAVAGLSGVSGLSSTSAENYSLVQLRFADGTNMDRATTDTISAVQQLALPEGTADPQVLSVQLDSAAVLTAAVSVEGLSTNALSALVQSGVLPAVQRAEGVASVSAAGSVERYLLISLNQEKIDRINDRLLAGVNSSLSAARRRLDSVEQQVSAGRAELTASQNAFGAMVSEAVFEQITGELFRVVDQLVAQAESLRARVEELAGQIEDPALRKSLTEAAAALKKAAATLAGGVDTPVELLRAVRDLRRAVEATQKALDALQAAAEIAGGDSALGQLAEELSAAVSALLDSLDAAPERIEEVKAAYASLTQTQLDAALRFAAAQQKLTEAEAKLSTARAEYRAAKAAALEKASVDTLLDMDTLAKLIYAQNFSMPAGYLPDEGGHSWLLTVGEEYRAVGQLTGALLCRVEGVGEITLAEVADVTVLDTAGQSLARLDGEPAVILSVYKTSTAGAGATAKACRKALARLGGELAGFRFEILQDQSRHISLLLRGVLSAMGSGAVLASVVLALFLRGVRPTLLVSASIPLSVLCAVAGLYFAGYTLNMMTLSGLALGIGMLVDNSVVVIENIYRLRAEGLSPGAAAVQGTRQVQGAVAASTLTSLSVFLPLIFTEELVRQMMIPLALAIGFCLAASLLTALTLLPAAASIQKTPPAPPPAWLLGFQRRYVHSLARVLARPLPLLGAAVLALAFCIWQVAGLGVVVLPELTGEEIVLSISTADGLSREQSYAAALAVAQAAGQAEGVRRVGLQDDNSADLIGSMTAKYLRRADTPFGQYRAYLLPDESVQGRRRVLAAAARVEALAEQAAQSRSAEVSVSAGGMRELTGLISGGLSIRLSGADLALLEQAAQTLLPLVGQVEGFSGAEPAGGQSGAALHLRIDKDRAAASGVTVAQVYAEIARQLQTTTLSTTVQLEGESLAVYVADNTDPLTAENLLDLTVSASVLSTDGTTAAKSVPLRELATLEYGTAAQSILRRNQTRCRTLTALLRPGVNPTAAAGTLQAALDAFAAAGGLPAGVSAEVVGENQTVGRMLGQMVQTLALGFLLVYLVMVSQFQSLRGPFLVLFTVPLAFTGGLLGLLAAGQQLSLTALMGFVVLMGTVVNNGIVLVDCANSLRREGLPCRQAVLAAGGTRLRPILMTALTTILSMVQLLLTDDLAGQLTRGMAAVVVGGLAYATLMTLYVLPVLYDRLSGRAPYRIDTGEGS